jgi:LmbE family N-acetylglucosaminyl deacetylase
MASKNSTGRVRDSMTSDEPWLFLSPHLDDAILSCGALLQAEVGHRELMVATVFTEASAPPHTHAAKSFMRQCSAIDARSLFAERRDEDQQVLSDLGVGFVHLGAADALFRRRSGLPNPINSVGRLVPELVHRYPTYRFDIAYGRVSRGDVELISSLQRQVRALMVQTNAELVFSPIGVGRHVDHLITRTIGAEFPDQVVYYSDFPYNQNHSVDVQFTESNGLLPWTRDEELPAKEKLIRGYGTQADALFPDGRIPVAPEMYYFAS